MTDQKTPNPSPSPSANPPAGPRPPEKKPIEKPAAKTADVIKLKTMRLPAIFADYPWTDTGAAERLVAMRGENFRYVPEWRKWLKWHGHQWELDEGYVYRMLTQVSREMHDATENMADDHPMKEAAQKYARKTESAGAVHGIIGLTKHMAAVELSHTKLDARLMHLPVKNGMIDLRTGQLKPSRRDDYVTKTAPVRFEREAKCPTWKAFLKTVMAGDKDVIEFLQRCVGYSLTGSVREQKLFFCYGPSGANGKSTFLSILRMLLGELAAMAPRKLLFQSASDRHPTELVTLHGRRLVTCSEVPESQVFDEALMKDITGSEEITCRRMQEDFWSYTPTHKLWLAGNHKPVITGTDGGTWRRIVCIPWEVSIPEEQRDKDLVFKLKAELSGILAWAVRGAVKWHASGMPTPAAVEKATLAYRDESDFLGEFFKLRVVFDPEGRISRARLRYVYDTFCEEVGQKPMSHMKFARRLREHNVEDCAVRETTDLKGRPLPKRGLPVDGWKGVRLITAAELEAKKA